MSGSGLKRRAGASTESDLDKRPRVGSQSKLTTTERGQAAQYARRLIEASLDPLVTISPDGKITDVNEATIKVTGIARAELIGTDFSNYFTEPAKAREGYQQVFAQGSVTDYPLTIRHLDGHLTEVLYNASVYRDVKGKVLGVFAAARDVTQQRQASQYARSLIEASLDPLVTISPEGKITDVNEATIKVTGVPRAALIGTDFSNYFTEPEKAREGYRQVFAKGTVTDYSLTIRRKDGTLVDVLYNASVYRDVDGRVLGVFAAARDVTESNRVLREFAETKNFLDNILQSSTKYSIIGKDLNRRILSWNEGAQRNYGYTAAEIIGQDSNVLHLPEDVASGAVDRMLKIAHEKGLAEREFMRVRKDGSRFMASVVVTRRNDAAGRPIGYLLMSNDISEKKQAEEQLRQASQYARSLIESSPDPLVTISPDGKITDVNEATIRVTGVRREQLIGTDFSDYFTEPDKAREGYQQVFAKGYVTDYPLTIRHHDGRLTDVLYNASVYKDFRGNVLGVFAAARDVTARKRAEEAVRQANAYNRSLIEANLDPLVTIGPDGKITDVNAATEAVTGCSRAELVGTDFSDYFTDPEKARDGYQHVFREGLVRDYPLELRRRDGAVTSVLYNASIYRDQSGNETGVFAAARDITQLKRAEDQIKRYAEDLKRSNQELENFAYVASHDLQEPLRSMSSFSQLLAQHYQGRLDKDADEFIAFIVEGAKRMYVLINDLLAFSRIGTRGSPFAPVDCGDVLRAAQRNLEAAIAESNAVVTHGRLPVVLADQTQFTQLFQNLLSNGIKFHRPEETPRINISARRREDGWQFRVRDNGIGIDPQFFDRIFIIFQRLHDRSEYPGTGIGLAICRKIVERHGGRMWVESEPGRGSIFHFTIRG